MLPRPERALLINYDFPPGLSGVRRIVKLARYLPEFNFEPHVLCATPDERMPLDVETLREVESHAYSVTRTPSLDPYHLWNSVRKLPRVLARARGLFDEAESKTPLTSVAPTPSRTRGRLRQQAGRIFSAGNRMLAIPDDRIGWLPLAIPAAEAILRQHAIRYVITSSFPHSTHLIGRYLKRRFRIHWIADFRDGWTQNPYFTTGSTALHQRWSAYLERRVALEADALTTVSDPIAQHLRELAGDHKVYTIPNGFDPDDLIDIEPIHFDKFTLAYTGTIFMQRSPENFFAAVRGLLDCYPGLNDNFQVIFRSKFKPEHEEAIDALNLRHVVQNWGMGSYRESLQLQLSADALLVLEAEGPNSEIMLTQKIFEYLAANKPILAIAPPGALATLVRQTRSGIVVPPENIFRIKETLFELFLGRISFPRDQELIATFNRRTQAGSFARIFEQLRYKSSLAAHS